MEGICHMSDLHVLVAGAGLGGLALAQGLRRAGIAVTVVERDASLTARRQGYRLHLDAGARDALVRVLPPASVRLLSATAGVPAPRFTVLDHQLGHVMTLDSDGSGDLAVDRLVLRRILHAGVEDRVLFGTELDRFAEHDDGVTAFLTDGSQVRCDVLVGADGIGSAVRRQYLPHARIVDTGVRQIYGKVALDQHAQQLFDEHMRGIFTGDLRGGRGHARDRSRRVPRTAARCRGPPGPRRGAAARGRLHDLLPRGPPGVVRAGCRPASRHERCGAPLDHDRCGADLAPAGARDRGPVRTASLFALPLRSSVPVTRWATTRVTLLGDAIHAMSPAAGAGACEALRDAARLTDALTEAAAGHDLLAALAGYEADMTARGFAAVLAGARNGERFLGQDPLPVPVVE
jgi:2-polyprenyl-6-methoxyphenol hydroxylase-like FAD-dependent oxidoreductase